MPRACGEQVFLSNAREPRIPTRPAARACARAIRPHLLHCRQVEAVPDGRERRWRLPHGALRGLLDPAAAELAELDAAVRRLREEGAAPERAALLEALAGKLRAAMRPEALRRADADLELLDGGRG